MGYFEKIANNFFREKDGKTIYYPNGMIGKGRVIPNEEIKTKLVNFHKRILQLSFFIVLPYAYFVGISESVSAIALSPVIFVALLIYFWHRNLVSSLEVHNSKLGAKDAVTGNVKALPNWYFWVFGSISLVLTILVLILPVIAGKPFTWPLFAVAAAGLFGFVFSVKMYRVKNLTKPSS